MKKYALHSVFKTIQGEGRHAGRSAVFVRFSGCNAWNGRFTTEDRAKGAGACARWCDTNFSPMFTETTGELVARVETVWGVNQSSRFVVLTGGEPALQVEADLVTQLHKRGFYVAVETNGSVSNDCLTHWSQEAVDWVACAPKLGLPVVYSYVHEVKLVLPGVALGSSETDWTDEQIHNLRRNVLAEHYWVQPQDAIMPELVGVSGLLRGGTQVLKRQTEDNAQHCIRWVSAHPEWKLGVQMHKFMGLE